MIILSKWGKFLAYAGFPMRVKTLDELIYNYPSPYLLDAYAKSHFKYTPDSGPQDDMYPVKEAWERFQNGTGNDCEEYARIFYEVLKNKYNCFQAWCFNSAGKGHAVVIFEENSWWRYISNWGLEKKTFKNLPDLYRNIFPNILTVNMIQLGTKDTYEKIPIWTSCPN